MSTCLCYFKSCSDRFAIELFSKMTRILILAIHVMMMELFLVFSYCVSVFPPVMSMEVEAELLLQFKSQLKDPSNGLSSWGEMESACGFEGVKCDPVSGKVTEISLDNKSLAGEIFPSIFALHSLRVFSMPSNLISGKIPWEISNCTNLRVLNLTGNEMVGSIPDLSGLRNLKILDLSINYFSGRFPSWLGNLTELLSLGLGENEYLENEIPESLGNLKNLTWLYLSNSHLEGEIPESIYQLKALQTLDISRNKLSGKISSSICKLESIYKIELFSNNLTGEIPPEIANLTQLQEIDISVNKFYGNLPTEIGNLKNLVVFQLYENNFSGELPSGFGDMKNLVGFSIYRNSFTGTFPENFGRFSPLDSIDISENNFSGDFPKFLCAKRQLRYLLALDNKFSGEFPDTYSECKSLKRFRVSKNNLSGKIADQLWDLPHARIIDLGDNDFDGEISVEIRFSTSLSELVLKNNRFSGKIPSEVGKLRSLEKLYLGNNIFTAHIPSEIGKLKQLSSLHLEENSLTGALPVELSQCSRLVDINLAWNSLSGNIPSDISLMSSLNSLNLSGNKLTGSIPVSLETMKLSSVDFSDNQFSGEVPSDLLITGGDKAFVGNKDLCVAKNSVGSKLSICSGNLGGQKRSLAHKLVFLCTVASILVVFLVGMLIVSHGKFKHGQADTDHTGLTVDKEVDSKWNLSSFHIDIDEICNLEEDNLIGSGATGKVYRVLLRKGSAAVAVKQLWIGDGVKILADEMEILGKIRHRNILKLYACLVKRGSKFLVFEYMPNGNLFQAIHKHIKGGLPQLDWHQRYKIALGAAKGIAYLHHDCSPPIIHRDIKSSNILLDDDYEPKIADFGLARMVDKSQGSDVSCLAGTHGYIAPELAYSLDLTEKSDVYSFGVVVLELVTGRKPIEEELYGEGKDLVYWVVTHLSDRKTILKVLDDKVGSECNPDAMMKLLRIGLACCAKLPSLRPTMRDVVKMLLDADPCSLVSPDNDFDEQGKACS